MTKSKSRKFSRFTGALAFLFAAAQAPTASALDEVTVAYFLEWPSPNLFAKAEGRFDDEMGVKVNWRAFGNGNEMTAAMVSGDVQIAYSQGLTPFVVGVTKGAPLKLVSAAVSYAENDNCIVHKDAGNHPSQRERSGRQKSRKPGRQCHALQNAAHAAALGRRRRQNQPVADESG